MNAKRAVIAGLAGVAVAYAGTVVVGHNATDVAGKILFYPNKLTGPVPLAVFAAGAGILAAWLLS